MGGSIAVTIREEDGTEHRMCRWTNPLPFVFSGIFAGEFNLEEYLKIWNEMREDYLENKDTGNFQHNMTSVYADSPYLCPMGYGLIVIDFQKKVIISSQGYTSVDTLPIVSLQYDREHENTGDSRWDHFKKLYPDKIIGFTMYDRDNEFKAISMELKEQNKIDFAKVEEEFFVSNREKYRDAWMEFIIDTSPFEVFKYKEHDKNSVLEMKEFIKELGFVLSEEEEQYWGSWIEERCQEE